MAATTMLKICVGISLLCASVSLYAQSAVSSAEDSNTSNHKNITTYTTDPNVCPVCGSCGHCGHCSGTVWEEIYKNLQDRNPVESVETPLLQNRKSLQFNVKTNLLYDLAAFPSLEVEIPIGERWSVALDGSCAWWKKESKDIFYQLWTLSPEARWWFGQKERFHGHYLGAMTLGGCYDLEYKKTGYQGEYWGTGLTYGYMFPVGKALSFEAGLGLGYINTEYRVYEPIDEHYVYQKTSRTGYWGPVKLKFSLVWRIDTGRREGRR